MHEITTNIQTCEKKIKEFSKENIDSDTDNIIKLNMQQTLYKNISDFTKKFKLNQEIYAKKYKELVSEEDPTYEINSTMIEEENNNNVANFLMTDNSDVVLQRRDNELNHLLNSVNDLTQIFKDMQTLVMEQGSLLDIIDYNIDIASTKITCEKKNIVKANSYHKNNCSRNVIIIIVCIFVEAVLLILKFI